MLPAQFRLKEKRDFNRVFRRGRGVANAKISVKAAGNNLVNSRFAFVVGTAVSKRAVRRNRLRRQMREVVRARLDRIKPGFDVVLMTRPAALDLNFQELGREIEKALIKLALL
jgi:ribonuclease P protein component